MFTEWCYPLQLCPCPRYGTLRSLLLLLLTIGYIASIVTQIPGGWLATKLGGKTILTIGILWPAIFTVITPYTASSLPMLLACRFLTGFGEGVCYPTIHAILSQWLPEEERSRFVTFIWGGGFVGTVIAMLLCPWLITQFNWHMPFIVFGASGLVWCLLWMLFSASDPKQSIGIHPFEIRLISGSKLKGESTHKAQGFTCELLGKIFSNIHIWAVIVNHFCNNWGFYILLTWLPTYLKDRHFDLSQSSWLSVLPFLTMFFVAAGGGRLADMIIQSQKRNALNINSETEVDTASNTVTMVRKAFGALGFSIPAACLVLINFTDNTVIIVALLVAAVGCSGLGISGYGVNHLDLSPKYAGLLLGLSNTAATIPGIVGVSLTGFILDHGSWTIVFYLASAIYMFGVVFWLLFATGKRQSLTLHD